MPRFRPNIALLLVAVSCSVASPALAAPDGPPRERRQHAAVEPALPVDIPFRKFVLPNGLTLVVHEDHSNPVAATCVWYHVGSKNERTGKTGFAHLFEHLMFNGSENHPGEWFEAFERMGGTDQNGTTNSDRTNYFQTVPVTALDRALWLESDRMGHLLGAIDQAKLDEQRGVVQNEKRQGENQPYGRSSEVVARETYPPGHGYSWTTIGSMEDLNAASLDDVRDWFRANYGASNAVLVVAGDVTPDDVRARVERLFGDVPSGPPVQRPTRWIARMTGTKRHVMEDRVPQARLTRAWNVPGWGERDAHLLQVAADLLAEGKTSRLWERLAYREQVATDVRAYVSAREIGGQFTIQVTANEGQDLARIEALVQEELDELMKEGPTAAELERVKTVARADLVRAVERIGGFRGRAQRLAESETFGGRPDAWKVRESDIQAATGAQVADTMRRWLGDGDFVLHVVPFKDGPAPTAVDRSRLPDMGPPPPPRFPALARTTLANGLRVVVAERHAVPLVQVGLVVDAGYAADAGAAPGTASLTLDLMDEGTTSRSALQVAAELDRLGAELSTASNLDVSTLVLSSLRENLQPSLALLADVVLHPAFATSDVERMRAQRLAAIAREKVDPASMALRVLPRLLYGEGHAYANPLTGTGTEAAVKALGREEVAAFHAAWFVPNNATLVVVGDTTLGEALPLLEAAFGGWKPGTPPAKNLATAPLPLSPRVFLVDKPGAVQSVIVAGHLAPPKSSPDDMALDLVNRILGGTFTSRLNMNLREDKHWSYGSRTSAAGTRGQRLLYANAPVQSDKTAEAAVEVLRELRDIRGDRPITEDELAKARDLATLTLVSRWETIDAVALGTTDLVRFGLDDAYWDSYPERVRAVSLEDVSRVARELVHPDALTWVIVGDLGRIAEPVRRLALGPVQVIDADGRPAEAGVAALP